jgi:hypothetical protein
MLSAPAPRIAPEDATRWLGSRKAPLALWLWLVLLAIAAVLWWLVL